MEFVAGKGVARGEHLLAFAPGFDEGVPVGIAGENPAGLGGGESDPDVSAAGRGDDDRVESREF